MIETPNEAAKRLENEASIHWVQGDRDAALQALQKAIFLSPKHLNLYSKLADIYTELCDFKSAIASLRRLFAIESDPPQRFKDQIAELVNYHGYYLLTYNNQPAVALSYLKEATELNPSEATYWLHRALASIQLNNYSRALKDVNHCIALNGNEVEYYILRTKLYWKLHLQDQAAKDIHKAQSLMPDNAEVIEHEQRLRRDTLSIYDDASQHMLIGDYDQAIRILTTAAEMSPYETIVYIRRAMAYREKGDFQAAISDTKTALSTHQRRLERDMRKEFKEKCRLEGTTDLFFENEPEVISLRNNDRSKEYQDIIKLQNLVLDDLGRHYLQEKKYQLALDSLNKCIKGEIDLSNRVSGIIINPQYYVDRGDAYRNVLKYQAAMADYHQALAQLPDSQDIKSKIALIHYQFGIELFNQGKCPQAEIEFDNAISNDNQVAEYHMRKADAARYQEKHDISYKEYQIALSLNPMNVNTMNKLTQYAVPPKALHLPAISQSRSQNQACHHSNLSNALHSLIKSRREVAKKNQNVKDLFIHRPKFTTKSSLS